MGKKNECRGASTVLKVHLDRRPVGSFAHPDVKIFPFAGLEEKHIVAIVEVCELVKLVELGFRV